MALTTTASALEDIKVNGQAKLWYETNNVNDNDLFDKKDDAGNAVSSGEVVFKLGVTGKQGNVGFGATVYQSSTMGLENNLVNATRTNNSSDMYTGEMYVTFPVGASTTLKIGKQELQTPFAYTEKWNATPNTFNAAVAINKSIENVTLVGAYVGQTNTAGSFKTDGEVDNSFFDGAYAAVAHVKAGSASVNAYYYNVLSTADAYWLDASASVAGVKLTGIYAGMMPKGDLAGMEDNNGFALSASTKLAGFNVMGAYSQVSDDNGLPLGNTATGFKKTKLPTAGVYTDGIYVAQPDSKAFKLKASTKMAGTGIALQYVNNSNDTTASKETQEIDLILSKKLGDVNMKAIILDRDFDDAATDAAAGGQHVRIIASVNF